uniref:Uncharacterized protein n=1 Tax=Ditylenchus dipsaci TaxID=166011 RepID=A0A915ECE8_9BILA
MNLLKYVSLQETLDVMKTYPAPNTLIQPLPLVQQQSASGAPFPQPAMAIPLPMTSTQDYRPVVNYQNNMPFAANTQQYLPNNYQPMQALPPQYSQTSSSIRKIFAQPTKTDMDKLFHLPADIIQRLAADAGYIDNKGDVDTDTYRKYSQEGTGDGGAVSSANSFNFNINKGPTKLWGMNQKGEQDITTTTRAPAIVASGKPRILMRSANREGKIIQIPVLAIPQPNGEIAYIPFERLSDLSDALAKLVSTGQIYVDDILPSSSIASRDEKSSKSKIATSGLLSNPLIDQTSDAIATNMVPTQTMRKIFPVKDVVYPSSSSVQTSPTNQEHIMIEPPTTAASTTEASETTTTTTSQSEETTRRQSRSQKKQRK